MDKESRIPGLYRRVVRRSPHSFQAEYRGIGRSVAPGGGGRYTPTPSSEASVDFFAFDNAYVERLRNGDPSTEHHFVAYFEELLRIKLRARALTSDRVEDLRQETFIRVIAALHREGGVRQPERFGAFVNSICNNVLMEHYRSTGKNQQMDETYQEIPDRLLDLEGMLVSKQTSARVRQVLEELSPRDRELLRAIFFEEKDKGVICRDFRVDRDYLRVLLYRAKDKFKEHYEKDQIGKVRRVSGCGI